MGLRVFHSGFRVSQYGFRVLEYWSREFRLEGLTLNPEP